MGRLMGRMAEKQVFSRSTHQSTHHSIWLATLRSSLSRCSKICQASFELTPRKRRLNLNSALHAPHAEDARGLAESEELKQTPTLGGDSISHPSVGVFPFIRTNKFQIFDQRIDGVVRNLELQIAAFHSLSRRHHDHAQSSSQRSHKYLPLQRSSPDTQSISILPIFKLIEILLNQPSGSINPQSFKRIIDAIRPQHKVRSTLGRLIHLCRVQCPEFSSLFVDSFLDKSAIGIP